MESETLSETVCFSTIEYIQNTLISVHWHVTNLKNSYKKKKQSYYQMKAVS